MAESRDDHSTGRMLFTDFDASDKGRPTADLRQMRDNDSQERRFGDGAMRSLDDLASSLDFDFEEDDGQPAPPPFRTRRARSSRFMRARNAETDADGAALPVPDGPEPLGEPPGNSLPRPSNPVTAWETGPSVRSPGGHPEETEFPDPLSIHSIDGDDRMIGAEQDAARSIPLSEDGRGNADEEEMDILSILSSGGLEGGEAFFGEDWRGRRLGMEPPRAIPYGGIQRVEEWYRPPENAEDDGIAAIPDWYEPPEETPPSGVAGDGEMRRDDVPAGAAVKTVSREQRRSTTRVSPTSVSPTPASPTRVSPASQTRVSPTPASLGDGTRNESETTGIVDIFSGVDVDALWDEKTAVGESAETAAADRDFIRFEDDELEAAWEKNRARTSGGRPPDLQASGETTILRLDRLDSASTIILSPEELRRRERSAGSTVILSPREPGGGASPLSPAAEEGGAGVRHPGESGSSPDNWDESESADFARGLDELIAMADSGGPDVNDAIAAPVVGNADIVDSRKKKPDAPENEADAAVSPEAVSPDEPRRDAPADPDRPVTADPGDAPSSDHDEAYMPSDAFPGDREPDVPDVSRDAAQPDGAGQGESGAEAEAINPFDVFAKDAAQPDGAGQGESGGEAAAINPLDVFANMDAMDFSGDGGLDDEMKALLDDDAAEEDADGGEKADGEAPPPAEEPPPKGVLGRVRRFVRTMLRKVMPQTFLNRIMAMVAWRENWWFYCDLLAAIIASASLAIIISYYVWYR